MDEIKDAHRTMFIKFPTVTKLVCPLEPPTGQHFRNTCFRSTLTLHTKIRLSLVSNTETFKIIQLPEKSEIMNICAITAVTKNREEEKSASMS